MKKIGLLVVAFLFIYSIAFASPLMDFGAGKGSIDLTWQDTQGNGFSSGESGDSISKYNFDGSLTFGLNNKFALQYRYFAPKNDYNFTATGGDAGTFSLNTNEVNVLYKLDKNVAAFAGLVTTSGSVVDYTDSSYNTNINRKNYCQVGLVASTTIADKTTLWGSAAAGQDLDNYGVGIGYEFSPGWEFNIDYRYTHFKALTSESGYTGDVTTKGVGYGITYKF